MNKIQTPQQQRSIEKKECIIRAGIEVMRTSGYYHVTTVEIAKHAGVSTGICYRYFNNKLDILLAALEQIMEDTFSPLYTDMIKVPTPLEIDGFTKFITNLLEKLCSMHESLGMLHNDLITLQHSEAAVNEMLSNIELNLVDRFAKIISQISTPSLTHPNEKLYIIYNLLEGYCHKKVFGNSSNINIKYLYDETIDTIISLIFSKSNRM